MSAYHADAVDRANKYVLREKTLRDQLGAGYDGIVFAADHQTAVKALRHRGSHQRDG